MAITSGNYVCRKKGAKGAMLRAAKYYTFRDGPDLRSRQWYSRDAALSYDELRQEVAEHAQTYGYSYRLVLSTKEARVSIDDYRATLGERFDHYYLIEHDNTDHPHAHVIGFTKKMLKGQEFSAMRERLAERECAAELGRAAQRDRAQEGQDYDNYSNGLGAAHDGLAAPRQREHDRGLG